MPKNATGGTNRPPYPGAGSGKPDDPGDEVLAAVLIRMWALASGRTLRSDVPPDQLSTEELIAFWADDMTPATGRHARPGEAEQLPAGPDPGKVPSRRRRKRRRSQGRTTGGRQEVPVGPAAA